ncbi:hypothetical protein STCU_02518 [Strigomonas culicis]|nr:hypothetical protein STCU_02518 [Strigomonas culicis]|eukprot:EPY33041.1 hypothetical protein STCU_02518 [Strigomonas culicis]
MYGGLTISVRQGEHGDKQSGGSKKYIVPVQIWLSSQYPIEPPIIYLIAAAVAADGNNKDSTEVKIVSNHPNVDLNGLCYCKYLSEWKPRTSSLQKAMRELVREFEACGVCPLVKDESRKPCKMNASGSGSDLDCVICYNKKDTVLVPCGHYCLCSSCAANVLDCPICRVKVKVRQRIFN